MFAKRKLKDIQSALNNTLTGVRFFPSDNMDGPHYFMISGPEGTPYEHRLFLFKMNIPETYPREPPKVLFISPVNRIHPNLYAEGKVCLSILGTFSGPSWTSMMNIENVMAQIQALLSNDALHHEPGHEKKDSSTFDNFARYATFVRTLEIYQMAAGLKQPLQTILEDNNIRTAIILHFNENKQYYKDLVSTIESMSLKCGAYFKGSINIDKTQITEMWKKLSETI